MNAARPATGADPVRATLIAILKQLNHAESSHEGKRAEQALELDEIERRLSDFWAIGAGSVKVSLVLGLLLRNGLVKARAPGDFSWQRQRSARALYEITPGGKKFLVEALRSSDRIG
ncbi:MAG TPA: hypothetical protein VMH78_05100 [Thermoplasmata archaeon]|nr:hypothetical protein [Thermoplasmata archaeon]